MGTGGGSDRGVAFYAVADHRHFVGAVMLLNSLRLQGHTGPLHLCDAGLTDVQRQLAEEHVHVEPAPTTRSPRLVKWWLPLRHPAPVMVVLDSDLIVTRPLHDLLARARGGQVVAFADERHDRFHGDWGTLLELEDPPTRRTYVNSGFIAIPEQWAQILRRVSDAQERIDVTRSRPFGGGSPGDPFYFPDQDTWNAVLMAETGPRDLDVVDHELAPFPPFARVRLVDAATLRCRYDDGREPYLLHHILEKPWLAETPPNIYSRLLPRLLLEDDVELRLPPSMLPRRYRPGVVGAVDRVRADSLARVRAQRGRLGLRRWVESHLLATRLASD